MARFGLLLAFFLILACEDDPILRILPKIGVDACRLHGVDDCEAVIGQVEVDDEVIKKITVFNPTAVAVKVTRVWLELGNRSPFVLKPIEPFILKPGEEKQLLVSYSAAELKNASDTLWIENNAINARDGAVRVKITAGGIDRVSPKARCGIESINGAPYQQGMAIEPLDDVVLTAFGSRTALDAGPLSFQWEIVAQPKGSRATLTASDSSETAFSFADGVRGVDLAGSYVVSLTVMDGKQNKSQIPCEITFDAVPTNAIHVQLVWDNNYGDMDLHLVKQGQFEECSFLTCRKHHESRPDWDRDGKSGGPGDPSLDIDDLSGYGPENINMDDALPGVYLVRAHFYSNLGQATNTVRVYLFGQLAAEFEKKLEPKEWWDVCQIRVYKDPSRPPCIEDLATSKRECPVK